jgi:hypothetical protein
MVGRLVVTDEMIKQFPSSERILPEAEYDPIIRGENILPMCSPLGRQLPFPLFHVTNEEYLIFHALSLMGPIPC